MRQPCCLTSWSMCYRQCFLKFMSTFLRGVTRNNLSYDFKHRPQDGRSCFANRTSQILYKLSIWVRQVNCRFGFVKSTENPADVATCEVCPSKLPNHQLWWTGPPWWLSLPPCNMPTKSQTIHTNWSNAIQAYPDSFELRPKFQCFCANLRTSTEFRNVTRPSSPFS